MAIHIHDSFVLLEPMRGTAIIDNYRPEIVTYGVKGRRQNTNGSSYACYQYNINTKSSKRLIQVSFKERAEAAFAQNVILGISVEFDND